jgi:hypothetical protein
MSNPAMGRRFVLICAQILLLSACSKPESLPTKKVVAEPLNQEGTDNSVQQSERDAKMSENERKILSNLTEDINKSDRNIKKSQASSWQSPQTAVATQSDGCTPRTISGSGDSLVDVPMQSGCRFATAQFSGKSNFTVEALDADGKNIKLIFNDIAPYSGQRPWNENRALYQTLSVRSNGGWSIDIR